MCSLIVPERRFSFNAMIVLYMSSYEYHRYIGRKIENNCIYIFYYTLWEYYQWMGKLFFLLLHYY